MSTEGLALRAYVPGLGAFLFVLTGIALFDSGTHPDPYFADNLSSVIGSTIGGALVVEILPALVGLFTFWSRDPARGLGGKLLVPALLYGLIESMVAVGSTVNPAHSEPSDVFSIAGRSFAVSAGALVVLLYLVQFAGRVLARRKHTA